MHFVVLVQSKAVSCGDDRELFAALWRLTEPEREIPLLNAVAGG
jgi:hypothetical protein